MGSASGADLHFLYVISLPILPLLMASLVVHILERIFRAVTYHFGFNSFGLCNHVLSMLSSVAALAASLYTNVDAQIAPEFFSCSGRRTLSPSAK